MIDTSVVKRLAIQCGAEVLTNDALITFEDYELQAFAQAVIEDYKASLVPVMWMWYDKPHDEKVYSDDNSPKPSNAIPLYALKESE